MQQLSGLDSMFLTMEDNRQHMHIASLGLYDPSTAKGGKVRFQQVLDFYANRVEENSFFRRRLVNSPYEMDRPFWVEDSNVDIEYHVRHIALPEPGDWRQLMIQVARIHSRALDKSKPLWEAYVIGGLDNIEGIKKGSFALYLKMHHSAVDGQAASQLIESMHTTIPHYMKGSRAKYIMTDRQPSGLELGLRSLSHRGRQVMDAGKLIGQIGRVGLGLGSKYRDDIPDKFREMFERDAGASKGNNKNRFDGDVSPHRVIDAIGLPFQECKTIRQHIPGVTINDIFLAAVSGAVRRYLLEYDELPTGAINTMMPMAATGAEKNAASANNVSSAVVCMHTDIAEPLQRLHAIHNSTRESKEMLDDIGRDLLPKLVDVLPAAASRVILEKGIQTQASLTVSNVRGPDIDLYLAGAKCQMFVPVSIVTDGVGLNLTGYSYLGTLWVCVTACREMLPNPEFFSQCLRDSFQELVDESIALGADVASGKPQARAKKRKASKKSSKKQTAKA